MLTKFRDNLYIGDEKVTEEDLTAAGITAIVVVADDVVYQFGDRDEFVINLHTEKINKPHVKDVACHIPKLMMSCGEIVAIMSKTGLRRAAFVACRVVCEMESKSIYEVMVELKELLPDFDIGKAYL